MHQRQRYPAIHSSCRTRLWVWIAVTAIILGAPGASASSIYKWKDAQGRIHVSDKPPLTGDAQQVRRTSANEPYVSGDAGDAAAAPSVVMLSTAWCGVCRTARNWLNANGIPFTEHDVERTETGKAEYRRLAGRGVPIILVGDQRMDGFSAARLETMLKSAK